MPNVDSVTVADLAQNVRLTVLQGEDYLNRQITTSDICRPSLEFAGYFKHYPAMRIQLLGITETSFAKEVPADKRREYIERMCTPQTPCFVVSTDLPVMDDGAAKGVLRAALLQRVDERVGHGNAPVRERRRRSPQDHAEVMRGSPLLPIWGTAGRAVGRAA